MPGPAVTQAAGSRRRAARLRPDPALSFFEFWPGPIFYLPVVLYWLALGLRHGNAALATAANPLIPAGGLCGESKSAILDQIAPAARGWLAPYACLTASGDAAADLAAAARLMQQHRLDYPLVAKPDIGCNGTGVRLVDGPAALRAYLAAFPAGERLMLQELVRHEGEAGLFYVRRPGEQSGRITSLTLKSSPYVIGDGRRTLRRLILDDRRAGRIARLYFPRLADRLDSVPAPGERVRLVFVGNHCKGAIFRNGNAEITLALTQRIDEIARAIPEFHFGRFDLRYRSLAELRRGEGFRLIEINGVGSEATHIWDPETRLSEAYAAQFAHYRLAFEIGAENRRRGFRPTPPLELLRLWRRQRRLLAAYPMSD